MARCNGRLRRNSMIDYKYADLFKQGGIDKQLKIKYGNAEIGNEDIFFESMRIEESLCSDEQLTFGRCEATMFKVQIANVFTSLKNQEISVSMTLDGRTDEPFDLGTYKVVEDKITADRMWREITAYDALYDVVNADAAAWYNSILPNNDSKVTMKQFRDSFFDYFGIDQENIALVNDSMVIEKTIQIIASEESETVSTIGEALSAGEVLRCICEINGCFGHIGRNGKFKYIYLPQAIQGLYPSNDLYPSDDLYPSSFKGETVSRGHYVPPLKYEDFTTKSIEKLVIRQEENDAGISSGTGDNTYTIQGNFFTFGKSQKDLQVVADAILSKIKNIEYMPFDAQCNGNPCYEVGDPLRFATDYEIVESYMLKRTLSGIQTLMDNYVADGKEEYTESINSVYQEIQQMKGNSNTLKRTLEETQSTIISIDKNLQTQITQTAESITQEVTNRTNGQNELSTRIEQTIKGISLNVNENDKTVGIVIQIAKEDGSTEEVTGDIDLTGTVTFSDLKTSGKTTINGDNITTGVLRALTLIGCFLRSVNYKLSEDKTKVDSGMYIDMTIGDIASPALGVRSDSSDPANPPFVRVYGDLQLMTGYFDEETGIFVKTGNKNTITSLTYRLISGPFVKISDNLFVDGSYIFMGTAPGQDVDVYFRSYSDAMAVSPVFIPEIDNACNLGGPSYRWKQIYSASSAISTSDRNQKKNEAELSDTYIDFFKKLIPKSFQFRDGTSGRTHIGFVAQDVELAMQECGLSDLDFAGFCKDIKCEYQKDESGKEILTPVLDKYGNKQYIYSLRYEEFIGLITKVVQLYGNRLEKLEMQMQKIIQDMAMIQRKVGLPDE